MKGITIALLLVLFGAAEVAVTATLVDAIGIPSLIGLYLITTITGAILLAWQFPLMNRLSKVIINIGKSDQLTEDLKVGNETPEVKTYRSYIFIGGIYTLSWILILIPGLVTDLACVVGLVVWFRRKQTVLEAINA